MLNKLKNIQSGLFTQTVVPIIIIGALLAYLGSSALNTLLVERFTTDQQQHLQGSKSYINQMLSNHYTLLFYLYGADAKDFQEQNEVSQREIIERLKHLSLANNDAIIISSEDGTLLFASKNLPLATQVNTNASELKVQNTNYMLDSFTFKPWRWHITYMLDVNNMQEIAKHNKNFMIVIILLIVSVLILTLSTIFYFTVREPLVGISTQLNNIIEGNYSKLNIHMLFGKEFKQLAQHLNQVTQVIQTRENDAQTLLSLSQQNEEYVEDILNSQRDIIVINDTKQIIDVNESFFRFFNEYTELEKFKLEHPCICDFFEKEDGYIYAFEDKNWVEFLFEHHSDGHKVKIIKDNTTYIFLIRAAKNKSANKVILTLTDITELETNKLKLIEAKEIAEAGTKAKSDFLANMSHEIRTPLNGILGFLQIMLKKEMEFETQKRYFLIMLQNGKNLLNIINDILDFSKIESGKMDIELRPCNLVQLMETGTAHFVDLAKEKKIEYILELEESLPSCLMFDDTRLNQVLYNLLSNALKFTPEDGKVTLIVKQNVQKSTIFFGVRDTGIGIAPQNLDKIFKAFEQEDLSTTKRFGGTGLGLSISSTLVLFMGGEKLKVKSELGIGSEFYFELPVKVC